MQKRGGALQPDPLPPRSAHLACERLALIELRLPSEATPKGLLPAVERVQPSMWLRLMALAALVNTAAADRAPSTSPRTLSISLPHSIPVA
eukprot:COSAG04_NODE_2948_length_3356_cov_33.058336_4_plen_91_part_00